MFPIPSLVWIKIAAIALICAGCYFMGWSHEHKKFVAFKAEIAALGKAQEALNEAKAKEHETISTAIKDEYEGKLAAVHNYYSNRVQPNPSSSNVPTVSNTSSCTNVSSPDTVSAGQCAETTLQLVQLQKWIESIKK